jgi:osmotically-inducible protein OsmY
MKTHAVALSLSVAAILVLQGCARTREGLKQDTAQGMEKAKGEAGQLKEEAKRGAEKAAEATSDALDEAGKQAAAASRTLAVKTALMADKRVDSSRVDVDSDYAGKVVHLRGKVTTEAEKAFATTIATDKADGWRVSNELVVAPAGT